MEKFLKEGVCPDCQGTRLSKKAREPRLRGVSLPEVCRLPLTELVEWVKGVPFSLSEPMRPMAESICESFLTVAKRLMDLGLGYLSLDRAASTLSTGERQRLQLARAVRNRTTGVLYVLDEPSIGLHPSNIVGLKAVMHDLIGDGNSVVLVDHDVEILSEADWIVEMGPEAGADGGEVIAEGTIPEIEEKQSLPYRSFPGRKYGPGPEALPGGRDVCEGNDSPFDRGHPYGEAPRGRYPQRPPHGRHRRFRFRQDHADSGKPCSGSGSRDGRQAPACSCEKYPGRGYHPGQTHRRGPHRHQRPFHSGDLCQCPR